MDTITPTNPSTIGWPAVAYALLTLVGMVVTLWNTRQINKRSARNADKLDHNTKLTERNAEHIQEVKDAVNGRMDQLIAKTAELAIMKSRTNESTDPWDIQRRRAEQVISLAAEKKENIDYIRSQLKARDLNKHCSILIVEDNQYDAETLSLLLAKNGFSYGIAHNSAELIEMINAQKYHAIFIDLNLPGGLCGMDVMRLVNIINPGMPIFVVTGFYNDAVVKAANILGAVGVIEKPVTLEKIDSVLKPTVVKT